MAENKKIKVLNDLLEETKGLEAKDYNFEKIMSLIEKSREMKKEEKQRALNADNYFKELKEKIAESTAYLQKARKDLNNMQEIKEHDIPDINSPEEYEALMQRSDQDIEDEITDIKIKLAQLQSRVKTFNEKSSAADFFYDKSMKTLESINKNLYGDEK